jgi:hypothetical protein
VKTDPHNLFLPAKHALNLCNDFIEPYCKRMEGKILFTGIRRKKNIKIA